MNRNSFWFCGKVIAEMNRYQDKGLLSSIYVLNNEFLFTNSQSA